MKTTRLALQNYDWSSLNAKEIFFLFDSHLKNWRSSEGALTHSGDAPGALVKVSVYLSDFGEKRLAQEKHHGPKQVFEELKEKYEKQGLLGGRTKADSTAIQSMINNDPLVRQYEIDRLKYYYAVLTFDSERAADWVYENCDGLEFEKSGMRIDLRGVPAGLEIPKQPSEEAQNAGDLDTKTLKKKKIKNLAKNHSYVELSWGAGRPDQKATPRPGKSCSKRTPTRSPKGNCATCSRPPRKMSNRKPVGTGARAKRRSWLTRRQNVQIDAIEEFDIVGADRAGPQICQKQRY